MARFCTQCGKPLEEGQICSCQLRNNNGSKDNNPSKEYQEEYQNETKQQVQQEINFTILKVILHHIINIIKKPASYGTGFVNREDTKSSWGIIGFHALLQSVFIVILLQRVNNVIGSIEGIFGIFMEEMNLGSLGQNAQGMLTISLLKGFILTLILSIAFSALYAGILYGISKLMGQNLSFQKMLCVSAVRSTACMIVLVAAGILFILNSTVGILIFFLGDLLGICFTMAVMPGETEENKKVFLVFLSQFLFVIVSNFIVLNYIPFYLPDIVRDAYEQIKIYLRNPYAFYNKFGGMF